MQYNCLFWYTMVLMLRFFKAFQGQPRLAQMSSILNSCRIWNCRNLLRTTAHLWPPEISCGSV